ncbi:MAG: hypothetical protein MZU97_12975 [Bacillus subtilis]|nr:hypothetical protein [Bacillus subtilis]
METVRCAHPRRFRRLAARQSPVGRSRRSRSRPPRPLRDRQGRQLLRHRPRVIPAAPRNASSDGRSGPIAVISRFRRNSDTIPTGTSDWHVAAIEPSLRGSLERLDVLSRRLASAQSAARDPRRPYEPFRGTDPASRKPA